MSDSISNIHKLIERLGNLLRADVRNTCSHYGIRPAQLEVLNYLARCNRYSDTPLAVTEYLGLTKGTVSQTLKILEEKGLLRKQHDTNDKRLVHLKPSARGRRLVERLVPSEALTTGINQLPLNQQQAIEKNLETLLRSMQKSNGLKTFAPCHSCRFNRKQGGQYFCELTQEPLSNHDITLLCREHQYYSAK